MIAVGDLSVDVAGLRALSVELRAGADELGAALGELSGATPGQLGSASLDEACEYFQHKWRHGMSLIRENVTRAGTGLDATADAYQQHEQDAATLFGAILKPLDRSDPFPGLGGGVGLGRGPGVGPKPEGEP